MVRLGQCPAAVAGCHVGDQFAYGRAADVLGRTAFGDAQGLVAVGESALLTVGAGGLHPECGPALGDGNVAPYEGPRGCRRDAGVRHRVAGRVLLVGDAAGYLDALTGEGVALALATAGAAVRCLAADRPGDYERAWDRLTRRHRLLTGALLTASRRPGTARLIVPAASRLPPLFSAAVHALQ